MYKTFYKLKKNPFQLSSDESFIWHNEEQKKALESLKDGIIEKAGFFLVTGGVGTGKTTFVSTLIKRLGNDIIHASVLDPRLGSRDLLSRDAAAVASALRGDRCLSLGSGREHHHGRDGTARP